MDKINILLIGANGRLGKAVSESVSERENCEIIAGVDLITNRYNSFPIFDNITKFHGKCDVIIDFSHPSSLPNTLNFAISKKLPVVISTTGLNESQISDIKDASKETPIFFSANMSLGVNLITSLAQKAAAFLGDSFDIEIVEKHHNKKIDSPSGTALHIGNEINAVCDNKYNFVFDRHERLEKRPKNEIGFSAIRGGTIVGEHDIIFAGLDEVITISHSAFSKSVFAVGSVNAALFLLDKQNGLYTMNDML